MSPFIRFNCSHDEVDAVDDLLSNMAVMNINSSTIVYTYDAHSCDPGHINMWPQMTPVSTVVSVNIM
ncbi:unnamed protein product [Oppiella nova]|uniref:Uncharacterized protein n=1 Tax=Oppiella nova TaxID=334625 RepID=A0A7R9M5L6_9ACAR|nr:unnamed protein product [Oppiella nova]CAG2171087.1 unnamed protein product [Oppiella nova]